MFVVSFNGYSVMVCTHQVVSVKIVNNFYDKVLRKSTNNTSPNYTSKHLKGRPISFASFSRNLTAPSTKMGYVYVYIKAVIKIIYNS